MGAVAWCRAVSRSRRLHIRSRMLSVDNVRKSCPRRIQLHISPIRTETRRSAGMLLATGAAGPWPPHPVDRSGGVKTELPQRSEEERS